MDCFMLMQCAITSGLRRPRNLSLSCRAARAPPAFTGRGVLNMGRWGRRRGGGKQRAASGGTQAEEPSPQADWGGGEDQHTGRESAPASELRERPHRVIKEEVVLSPPPQHLHLHPAGPHFLSSVPLTEMFIKQQQYSDPQEMK